MPLVIGRFEIQKPLGEGGIGEAFLVRDRFQGGRLAVLKRVSRRSFPKAIESLRQEFVTLTKLAHPNIARVEDFGADDEAYFFVEEFVDGGDFFTALAGANYNQILGATAQALRALHYIHHSGLVHGDLKPENILIVRGVSPLIDDAVKLIDFGLATHLDRQAPGRRSSGTFSFMAPEVLLERPVDHRADLYALGVCLYRLLTGRLPFDEGGETPPAERMRRRLEGKVTEPRWVKKGIPRGLNDLTTRLLEKEPEARFPSASAALEFLNQIEKESFPLCTASELRLGLYEGPFLGREKEIEAIFKAWGTGKKEVLLTGPSGIGKSRLIGEVKRRLQLEGRSVTLKIDSDRQRLETDSCLLLEGALPGDAAFVVPVSPWSFEEIVTFLQDRLRLSEIPKSWRDRLGPLTGGSPDQAIGLAEYLLAEGMALPSGVSSQKIFEARLRRLDDEKKEILRLCALARVPLSLPLLTRLIGRPRDEVERLLQEIERDGWMRRQLLEGTYHYHLNEEKSREFFQQEGGVLPIPQLLELAEERYRTGDLVQAVQFLDQVSARGEEGLTRPQRLAFYKWSSIVFAESGGLDRAAAACEKLSALNPRGDSEWGELLDRWGWVEYLRGHYETAFQNFSKAADCWERVADSRHRAATANYRGMSLQRLHRLSDAVLSYQEALSFLKKEDPIFPVILMNLGTVTQEAQQFETSLASFQEALALAEKGKDRAFQGQVLNNLANLYLYFGKLDQASEALHQSLRLAIENGLLNLEGYSHLLLGVIADKEGRPEAFREGLEKAEKVFEREGGAAERQTVLLHRGYYEQTAGHEEAALRIVARLREETFDSPLHVQVDLLEGKIAAEKNPPDTARGMAPLTRAVKNLQAAGDWATLWDVCLTLGRLWSRERPDVARDYYERAIRIIDELAQKVPAPFRPSFFRDRKQEKIREELNALKFKTDPKEGTMEKKGLSHLMEINRILASQHNLEQLLESMMDAALDLLQAERGFILLLEGTEFNVKTARNLDKQSLNGEAGKFSRSIAGKASSSGRAVLVANAREDDRFRAAKSVIEQDIRSAVAVPLKLGPQVIGVIYVDSRFEAGLFDPDHVELLETFADQAAVAVRNARQLQEIYELNRLLKEKLDLREHEVVDLREKYEQQQEDLKLRYSYDQIVGRSKKLKQVLKLVDKVVDADVTVLITGESGTGKELIARALHYNGPRKDAPFVAENCAAFSETLLESELFGHVKGGFTGAIEDKKGLFEVADGGTIFLDEIAEMSLGMQAKLLRVLQEKRIRPIGSNQYKPVDVRVVCATNQNLSQLVTQGVFREDLYYRINVVRVMMPPLRDRKEDVPPLVEHFLEKFKKETGRAVRIDKKAMQLFLQYDWPGNVREMANEIEKCCALGNDLIRFEDVSDRIHEEVGRVRRVVPLDQQVSSAERVMIAEALKKFNFSRVKTAQALGISRITLYKKMKSYGITGKKGDYKGNLTGAPAGP